VQSSSLDYRVLYAQNRDYLFEKIQGVSIQTEIPSRYIQVKMSSTKIEL